VAEKLLSACLFQLEYLCKFSIGFLEFYREAILPLCGCGWGSVESLRELPISLLNRLLLVTGDEDFMGKYNSIRGFPIKGGGRR
jgi:hypothetical protein